MTTKSPSEIPPVSSRDLIRELERAPRGALAFDGDGTLWSGDVGEDFYFGILDSGTMGASARDALLDEARKVVEVRADIARVGRDYYAAYHAGRVDELLVCEVMTWISAGWTEGETRAFVDSVIDDAFVERLHPEVAEVARAARAMGHEIFVVSASPRPIVEAAAAIAGIPRENVIAADAIVQGDRFIAAVRRPIPYGPGKSSALRAKLEERSDLPLLAAFGDSAFDEDMLRASERPVAVRPKPKLVARAPHLPKLRVLAR